MWIELRFAKYIDRNGKLHRYPAGEVINVGAMDAKTWINDGSAICIDSVTGQMPGDSGFCVNDLKAARDRLHPVDLKAEITLWPIELEWSKTLIWDVAVPLRGDLVPVGFNLLAKWQVCVPLWSYTELACHVGTEAEREMTRDVIRDLRVPIYDTRMIFVRRCADTRALIDDWLKECESSADKKLAWMRSVYRVKPVLCALPASWSGR